MPWNLLTREEIGAVLLAIRKAGKSAASVEQVRCPLTRFYQWQQNVHGYGGPNPAAELKFFIGRQPSKKARKRDVQWFRQAEARTLLEACATLKPRWVAFLMVFFGGGLRWGETTALSCQDIDWHRGRVHVARTWSEGGGRIEAVFPNTVGRVTRYRAFLELVWQPLLQGRRGPLGEAPAGYDGGAPNPSGSHGSGG